ncbi:SpoT Guanosine polyphosphate pyrophosphohydrolases/synthetases [Burkholderiaceae bacterium]
MSTLDRPSKAAGTSSLNKGNDPWFGEGMEQHALEVAAILQTLRLDEATLKAADHLHSTLGKDALMKHVGQEAANLLIGYRGLRQAQAKLMKHDGVTNVAGQEEILRKMLLAFGNDLRVVLIYLASRLQTLRWIAKNRLPASPAWAQEILDIDASLANRLGIWQMKWEMEDLAFRVLTPATYKEIAGLLDSKRVEREQFIVDVIARLNQELQAAQIHADVQGRPKHIYSIWKKMQGKSLEFANLYDVRAFRILVDDVKACYATLGLVHNLWQPVPREFDDYIARPKPNGYQSLHTVVIDEQGISFEIQIRTHEMHRQAEYGLAAHWRYKEGAYAAGANDLGTHSAEVAYERQIAWARQLISWKEDAWEQLKHHEIDDHIYVLTPLGKVISLEKGSSPIDFAYAVHTDLGHRCRGARIDGAMVPLDTALSNGQTVEIISVKQGGPSRDWLNPERGYLRSQRARARVRAWFNALDDEANQSPTKTIDPKTEKVADKSQHDVIQIKTRQSKSNQSGDVLVVGVDSLLTQLAKCCRPVPPDPIAGFVTQGRGVSIHRRTCKTFRALLDRAPERVIQTAWSGKLDPQQGISKDRVFPADLAITALDRPELMRELFEITSKIGVHVIDLKKSVRKGLAQIQMTIEIQNTEALRLVQTGLEGLRGVTEVRRR